MSMAAFLVWAFVVYLILFTIINASIAISGWIRGDWQGSGPPRHRRLFVTFAYNPLTKKELSVFQHSSSPHSFHRYETDVFGP